LIALTLALASIATLAADDVWVIREDGVGPAKIGMTISQLNTVLGEKFAMPREKDDQACFDVQPTKHSHISFMIEDGRLSRVDVDAPGISTTEGIQVGDSEAKAQRVYGSRLKVEPHHSIDEGHYLTVRSRDGRYGTRFETEKGKIRVSVPAVKFYGLSVRKLAYWNNRTLFPERWSTQRAGQIHTRAAAGMFDSSSVGLIGHIGSRGIVNGVAVHDQLDAAVSLPPLRRIIGSYRLRFPEPPRGHQGPGHALFGQEIPH
jgi:hypothetical protein